MHSVINKIIIVPIQRSSKFKYTIKIITIYFYNAIQNLVSACLTKIEILSLDTKSQNKGTNLRNLANWQNHGILYKFFTYLVWIITVCQSLTGKRTFSTVMPMLMTQSAALLLLNLPQVRIWPPASRFSLDPIHLILCPRLHRLTFGLQQVGVRHPFWTIHISPQWLWLWHHKCMWVGANDVLQTITWVNICSRILPQVLKSCNCMWTRDLLILALSTTTCSVH